MHKDDPKGQCAPGISPVGNPEPQVNVILAGVQKAGTTALCHHLKSHPDICLAKGKEVHLFDKLDTAGLAHDRIERFYAGYFSHRKHERFACDATPAYLYMEGALEAIRAYNPDIKLIVVLRDPIERAVSHYRMMRERDLESWPLLAALALEPVRLWWHRVFRLSRLGRAHFSYVSRGRYRRQLRRLYALFPHENVLLLSSVQLKDDHRRVLRKIASFLDVEEFPDIGHRLVFETQNSEPPGYMVRTVLWLMLRKEQQYLDRLWQAGAPILSSAHD